MNIQRLYWFVPIFFIIVLLVGCSGGGSGGEGEAVIESKVPEIVDTDFPLEVSSGEVFAAGVQVLDWGRDVSIVRYIEYFPADSNNICSAIKNTKNFEPGLDPDVKLWHVSIFIGNDDIGKHRMDIRVIDEAGNMSEITSVYFTVIEKQ
jgi:hypothetical protein